MVRSEWKHDPGEWNGRVKAHHAMINVGILGATGYTALELIKILLRHPDCKISVVTSRQEGGVPIDRVHPQLAGRLDLRLEPWEPLAVAKECDCVFSCLPHAASAASIRQLLATETKVIDFSADYRLWDAELYADWYGSEHPDPERLGQVAYGLPELYRERIEASSLVANPGCYPTSAILAMTPLLRAGLVTTREIIFDAKSGVSGAGRNPKLETHFPECNESVAAYGLGRHRHTPEIAQILRDIAGDAVGVLFTPHLIPMDRGILTTGYATAATGATETAVMDALSDYYRDEPFVHVVEHLPATKDVSHTNHCHVTARLVGNRVVTVSVIDNLIKGASGAAVQNMNLMFGLAEATALL